MMRTHLIKNRLPASEAENFAANVQLPHGYRTLAPDNDNGVTRKAVIKAAWRATKKLAASNCHCCNTDAYEDKLHKPAL